MAPERHPLGGTGLSIAPLMFGGNVFGWTADEAMSFRLLDAFVDAGFNAIDTADVYSRWVPGHVGGESETIIGAWMKARGTRHRVMIATKVGMELAPDRTGLSPRWIAQSVEDSLKRLGTDHIDLYQAHRPDPAVPIAETLGAFQLLIEQGKVRAIGASNYDAAQLAEALDVAEAQGLPRYATLQPKYNLMDRAEFEDALQPLCVARNVAVIPFYGVAAGFLTGKYRSTADIEGRPRAKALAAYANDRGWRVVAALDAVAARLGAAPVEVAIAWLRTRPALAAPIASATSPEQLAALLRGATLALDAAAIATLDAASTA
ncbi:aldo/keto reductase [Falsiroseomonas stagni]|uniref:Predicted oxidoreductase n=1 Tax=Falsiroseomonas stagni DSM 19981 TaxID=1123062 RepID=A0A1I4EYC4_9PROT|nr:aldo/keto reductase [Falsiroseomonas stagni]SFL10279.1 Predicted oxidoreductase [Falsiroseomonas stagni DSM 19981]